LRFRPENCTKKRTKKDQPVLDDWMIESSAEDCASVLPHQQTCGFPFPAKPSKLLSGNSPRRMASNFSSERSGLHYFSVSAFGGIVASVAATTLKSS
jgi:hypothetical protein